MDFSRARSLLLLAGLGFSTAATTSTANSQKVSQLLGQPEGLAQLSQLSATDLKFDFKTQPTYTYQPGGVINANTDSFPVGNVLALSLPQSPSVDNNNPIILGCGNVQLVSALNAENAGTLNTANNFYRLNDQIIGTVLGATGSQLNATMNDIPAIGTGSNAGSVECLSRCGLNDVKPGSASD
ncbi:MAG: hypothetical protein Q9165_001493 [Trypethelium subeluteriae]